MSKDISSILTGWDFEADEIQVRIIPGDDGRDKLQMRVDLGVLQMELQGRPDGQKVHGCDSLLEYFEARAEGKGASGLVLSSQDCAELFREGAQYYHRYLALFHLHRFDLVARDTARNLRLFHFVSEHAENPQDKLQFEQFRPYVTMMHTRALAQQAIDRGEDRLALDQIDRGIVAIQAFLAEHHADEKESSSPELQFLRKLRSEVERSRTIGPVERLEDQLALAVAREDYEEAAHIRDQIRRLRLPGGREASPPISPDPT